MRIAKRVTPLSIFWILMGFAVLTGTLSGWTITSASAAEFYFIGSPDKTTIILLDRGTIVAAPNQHKIAHFASVNRYSLWNDDKMELDCAGNRLRKMSTVSHLAGGSTQDYPKGGTWDAPQKEAVATNMLSVVCKWPQIKPTGNSVFTAPDFQNLIDRVSVMLSKN